MLFTDSRLAGCSTEQNNGLMGVCRELKRYSVVYAASSVRGGGRQEHQDDVMHCPPGPVVDLASPSGDILKIRRR